MGCFESFVCMGWWGEKGIQWWGMNIVVWFFIWCLMICFDIAYSNRYWWLGIWILGFILSVCFTRFLYLLIYVISIRLLYLFIHFSSLLYFTSFHFTSFHFTSLHFTLLHFTSLYFLPFNLISYIYSTSPNFWIKRKIRNKTWQ